MKFTNISKGPRGLNTTSGTITVGPGQTVDAEVSEAEAKSLSKEWWETGSKAAAKAAKQEEEKPGSDGGDGSDGSSTAAYKAVHRGAGSFSIMDGEDNEVIEKITKAEAEKFNKLSDEEKTEYVLANAK